jgi:hypothetical protein
MLTKTQRIIGWTLTVLVGLFLIGASGAPKFLDISAKPVMADKGGESNEFDMATMMAKLQIPLDLLKTLGVIEISVAVLYLIPRTAFLGAILATAHLGGAVWTHLRVGEPWFFPIIIGVLMWLGLALRRPVIFRLLLGQESLAPPINDAAQR